MKSRSAGAVSAARPQRSMWIVGPWQDLLLFVATPLMIIPAIGGAGSRFSVEQISLFVASFGAMGHHFPGILRAYGDRALFRRFKVRFIVAPLFLATVCTLFGAFKLSGILVIAFFWGVWHALMQTYGFIRIYDAKAGSVSYWTCKLDLAMCIAWFGLVILWSPTRLPDILGVLYKAGFPVLSHAALQSLQYAWTTATALVSVGFLVNTVYGWKKGAAPSPVKFGLMASTFAFFWYANVTVPNILLSIALFEIFHDVQYLSIVWLFNRSRVEKDRNLPSFTRFLFRRSGTLVGLYVGLVFGYGALNLLPRGVSDEALKSALAGLLVASGLLHFYYDGFIWKIREGGTGQPLGIRKDEARAAAPATAVGWKLHALRWALFAIPVGWFGIAELRGTPAELERRVAIADALPDNATAAYDLGAALSARGRYEEAAAGYRRAVELRPGYAEAHNNLGAALGALGQYEQAVVHYRRAIDIRPEYPEALNNLGIALSATGRFEEAAARYTDALRLKPENPEAENNLGMALASGGRPADALPHFERALELRPDYSEAHANLGLALFTVGRVDESILHYAAALQRQPGNADLHFKLGLALESRGDSQGAAQAYARTLELAPAHPGAAESLLRIGVRR